MLDIKFIKENKDFVIERLQIKNFQSEEIVKKIVELDEERKKVQTNLNDTLSKSNKISKEIGFFFKNGKIKEANDKKKETSFLKERSKNLNQELVKIEKELNFLLVQLPNLPHISVPAGKKPEDNIKIKEGGNFPNLQENSIPHWEIAKKYNLIDFELGNKLTGAGFPVYTGKGAKMQRALISFFIDEAEKLNYKEIMPPLMVNENSAFATGQLPDKDGQMYKVTEDNLYLIPTAEVPVTNIYRNCILNSEDFPIKNVAYTPCFRREAGSYGKNVRGLNRLHQFDKVEIVQISNAEKSYDVLNEMVDYVESLIKKLELPYRILKLCGGDMGFTSALTFDFEVFSASQEKWLEVSSVSNFENYQANRLKLRYKEKNNKKTKLAHTLNGSALALPRILAAILENNQNENGIKIPKVLQKYTNFELIF
ncbi:MAG: serine--tRNA ligase [Bacteroidetes bacterium 4572_128]|nr:MAG: serine--tRNA ligase [Bacteroidetes bacterium 4572_128]